jgi:hypothetical protein
MLSGDKVDAVYDLREAVEEKVRAELEVDKHPSPEARDTLLEATLNVESRTQRAIQACHACGRVHLDDPAECPGSGNVRD